MLERTPLGDRNHSSRSGEHSSPQQLLMKALLLLDDVPHAHWLSVKDCQIELLEITAGKLFGQYFWKVQPSVWKHKVDFPKVARQFTHLPALLWLCSHHDHTGQFWRAWGMRCRNGWNFSCCVIQLFPAPRSSSQQNSRFEILYWGAVKLEINNPPPKKKGGGRRREEEEGGRRREKKKEKKEKKKKTLTPLPLITVSTLA